ncbi:MAG: FHA domain-containing protein [Candidatus Promineifilaceae bacterium]|nr:FHA domain-containing protein [Candidatus Promineifilaceae bacterium]
MASIRAVVGAFLALLLIVVGVAQAQEQPSGRLFITDSDTSRMPVVTLRAYGLAGDGRPLDLAEADLLIFHDGEPVNEAAVEVGRAEEVGTLTVFLIDATSGVEDQLPTIQQRIEEFASATYMKEQVDVLAIYRVGETGAELLLEPTGFYNSVRNFFSSPLEASDSPTALIDSTMGLLNDVQGMVPEPAMFSSIVVFSDGTDAVSTQYEAGEVAPRAAELGVPVHTVWLQNEELSVSQEAGRTYLEEVAAGSRGVAARLSQPETITTIFERTAELRNQRLLHYRLENPAGGDVPVRVGLAGEAGSQAETMITISASAPTVTLNIPPESRTISLPALDEPVRLTLSGEVGWLDGVERRVETAALFVNGQRVADVPAGEVEQFQAEIPNFFYGANTVHLAITDEQGMLARSPQVTLTVAEGERAIPEAVQPPGFELASAAPICLGAVLLLAILGLGGFLAYRSGRLPAFRGRSGRKRGPKVDLSAEEAPSEAVYADPGFAPGQEEARLAPGYLEVIEAATPMPAHIPLHDDETRLGRSPSLSEVAFEQDPTVSRLHATIIWDGQVFRIYDDESTSGTWVNDQEVSEYGVQLYDGDDIFLGKVQLRFYHES